KVWLVPRVLEMALSQSLPTPIINEPARVLVSVAAGTPGFAFPVPVAPIAPEPFEPEISTPEKVTTVTEATTLWERVAVTVIFVRGEGAKARQISEVPFCPFVL